MGSIHFFQEDTAFSLKNEDEIRIWIRKVIQAENRILENVNYIFCSDSYLHKMNQKYLKHDSYTDIITFDNTETDGIIEGDIFISIDRIKENCINYNKTFENELFRVIVHGILHLVGYKDKNKGEQLEMRKKEDKYLKWITNS